PWQEGERGVRGGLQGVPPRSPSWLAADVLVPYPTSIGSKSVSMTLAEIDQLRSGLAALSRGLATLARRLDDISAELDLHDALASPACPPGPPSPASECQVRPDAL